MIPRNLKKKQAEQAFSLRNKFRTEARALMKDRETAQQLMSSDPNQTWGDIVKRQIRKGFEKDDIYQQIIKSSQKSRDAVNKSLGIN